MQPPFVFNGSPQIRQTGPMPVASAIAAILLCSPGYPEQTVFLSRCVC